MKRLFLIAALAVLGTTGAMAQPSSWTGWYAGASGGYGWSDRGSAFSPNDDVALFLFPPTNGTIQDFGRLKSSGAVGGVQVGYNYRFTPNAVAGIEADFNFSDVKGSSAGAGLLTPGLALGTATLLTSSEHLKWFGTVRGRLGFLPTSNFLLFGTAGLAYGRVDQSTAYMLTSIGAVGAIVDGVHGFDCITIALGQPCLVGSTSQTRVGWTAGAGAEWMLWKHLSLKAEYSYIDLGSASYRVTALNSSGAPNPASFTVVNQFQYHIVRAGLNWHF